MLVVHATRAFRDRVPGRPAVPVDTSTTALGPWHATLLGWRRLCRTEGRSRGNQTIVATSGAIYRGIVQYYLLAGDVYRLHRLRWVMETSMLKTLAGKHHSTVSKMAAKHKTKIQTPRGLRTCFEARI